MQLTQTKLDGLPCNAKFALTNGIKYNFGTVMKLLDIADLKSAAR